MRALTPVFDRLCPATTSTALERAPIDGSVTVETEKLRALLLWLMGFASAFVFIEPSPYEIVALASMFLLGLAGLRLSAALMPLALMLAVLNIGYAIAVVQVSDQSKPVTWMLISNFLAVTGVFYAAVLSANTQARLEVLLRGCLASAVVAALAAVAGYFHLAGGLSDALLLYGRARGTFNDPNVLGAFLVLPAVLLFQRVLIDRRGAALQSGLVLVVLLVALLLTFSRAAWGQFVLTSLIVMALGLGSAPSAATRLRIIAVAVIGFIIALIGLAVLLSLPQVADLFSQRATLDQSYDIGHFGRFGRYLLGAELGLERPFGIGPLQFAGFFGEDPHNSFLNAFMSGGWLSGFAYLTLTATTLVSATRFLRAETPWRSLYQVIYAAYVGVAVESVIIDIDHWRHYFLILGTLWGMMAASRSYLVPKSASREVS
ncbi:MAG TPA: O-antigen ligase domain-containing protein [Xanthobacteraceae bacterium]|nr:O-antigen ligase domain-containing protein [Xanthobacteraceae bacterium]